MTRARLGGAGVLVATAVGCTPAPTPTMAPPTSAPVAAPSMVNAPEANLPPPSLSATEPTSVPTTTVVAPPPPTRVSSAGVGPIGPETADDLDAIRSLLQNFTVSLHERQAEDHDVGEYTVWDGTRRVLLVVFNRFRGPRPFRVDVLGAPFTTERGVGAGSSVAEARAAYPDLGCRFERYDPDRDIDRVAARLFCETSELPGVQLDLELPAWRGRPGPVGTSSIAKKRFVRLTWLGPL